MYYFPALQGQISYAVNKSSLHNTKEKQVRLITHTLQQELICSHPKVIPFNTCRGTSRDSHDDAIIVFSRYLYPLHNLNKNMVYFLNRFELNLMWEMYIENFQAKFHIYIYIYIILYIYYTIYTMYIL
jgi:hypothetical protein